MKLNWYKRINSISFFQYHYHFFRKLLLGKLTIMNVRDSHLKLITGNFIGACKFYQLALIHIVISQALAAAWMPQSWETRAHTLIHIYIDIEQVSDAD